MQGALTRSQHLCNCGPQEHRPNRNQRSIRRRTILSDHGRALSVFTAAETLLSYRSAGPDWLCPRVNGPLPPTSYRLRICFSESRWSFSRSGGQTQPCRLLHAMDDDGAEPPVRLTRCTRRSPGGHSFGHTHPAHRKGFDYSRHKSKPAGRPRLPKRLQEHIRRMSAKNPRTCRF